MAKSTLCCAKARKEMAVMHSKNVGCAVSLPEAISASMEEWTRDQAAAKSWSEIFSPLMRMRSLMLSRCGEVYRPVRNQAARRMDSSIAAVEPLPLVPAMCAQGEDR